MKLFLVCTFLSLSLLVLGHPSGLNSEPNPLTSSELESLLELSRPKRSGSSDFISGIKKGILHAVGHASASSAGASSGKSSGKSNSHEQPHNYDPYDDHHNDQHDGKEATVDALKLKKQILHTLFQAVKAVTGGVAALKGQLIKGSGYIVAKGGKLIQASGDGVTHVGKKLINGAKVQDSHEEDHHHHHEHHADYEVHHHHSGHGHSAGYSSPGHTGHSAHGHTGHSAHGPTGHSGHSGYAYAPVYYGHTAYGPPKGVGYHASTNNHISASEDVSFAKLPYPVPFKTAGEQQHGNHHEGAISLDPQLPVNIGGQAAFDFLSSYDAPPSGVLDNSLNGGDGGHAGLGDINVKSGSPASAVEALREILNRNIPYTDQELHNKNQANGQAIDVHYSDQGLSQNQFQQHDHPNTQFSYGGTSSSSFSSVPSTLGGNFPLNDHVNNLPNAHIHVAPGYDQHYHNQHHTSKSSGDHQHTNNLSGADSNPVVQQYEIPPDPHTYVPAFKPLTVEHYGPPLPAAVVVPSPPLGYGMPVRSVYQSQSVHTAYGPPPPRYMRPAGTNNNHNLHHFGGGFPGGSGPGPIGGGYSKTPVPNRPGNAYLPPGPPHQSYGPPPTGPYTRRSTFIDSSKLHGKRSNMVKSNNIHRVHGQGMNIGGGRQLPGPVRLQELSPPPLPPSSTTTTTQSPPQAGASLATNAIVVADQQPEHEYQLQRLQDDLGLDIEVQKSVSYELDGQGHPKAIPPPSAVGPIRRSTVEEAGDPFKPPSSSSFQPTNPLATGPIYSRPYSKQRRLTPKKYTFHRF